MTALQRLRQSIDDQKIGLTQMIVKDVIEGIFSRPQKMATNQATLDVSRQLSRALFRCITADYPAWLGRAQRSPLASLQGAGLDQCLIKARDKRKYGLYARAEACSSLNVRRKALCAANLTEQLGQRGSKLTAL